MFEKHQMNFETITIKIKVVGVYLIAGSAFAPLFKLVNKYLFSDWEFINFLIVICAVDTLLGFVKALKQKNISSRGFSMVFKKIIIYSCALITSHAMVNYTVGGKVNRLFTYFDFVVFSSIMVREGISIFENIASIDPKAFPKRILKYLRDFDSLTGEMKNDKCD